MTDCNPVLEKIRAKEKENQELKKVLSALIAVELIIAIVPFTKPAMPTWAWTIWILVALFMAGLIFWNWVVERDSEVSLASLSRAAKVMGALSLCAIVVSIAFDPSVMGKKTIRPAAPTNLRVVN